jgi:hypothetical protein
MGIAVCPWSTEMPQHASVRNPFMLMISPEVVLAAIEKSERLSQLNRHLCRPLDRPAPAGTKAGVAELDDEGDDQSARAE